MDIEEKAREVDLLNRTVKRLHRIGACTQEQQLLALAKEIEYYREKIRRMDEHIDRLDRANPRQIVAVKMKANPALLVKAPPLPVGYEPDPGRRKRRQP